MKVLGGTKRHIFHEIVGIKVSRVYFLTFRITIFQHIGRIFIRIYALYIYIYIYNKFTEASHHNTLNITQNRWM